MIDANELRKGIAFMLDGEIYEVLEYQHYKPGRGNAIIRTKIRNLRSGSTVPRNFLSGERLEEADVERRGAQYLYQDTDYFYFMDTETYEQTRVKADAIQDKAGFLKEGMDVNLTVWESEVFNIDLPTTVEMEIVDAEMAVAGDTATGATKQVVCETGLKVQVPMFVQLGDTIRVDTRDGAYVTRVQ